MDSHTRDVPEKSRYTPKEELANSLTHGIGTALAIAGLTVLVVLAANKGDAWRVVGFSIYGATLVMLYLASTLYHAVSKPEFKTFFRILDHGAIFLLIAGSYTPLTLVTLRGPWGWTLFGLIWGVAVIGLVTTILFLNAPRWFVSLLYIGMGWMAVIAIKPLIDALPLGGMLLLGAGGLAYTGGVVFYIWEKLPYNHAVWHLFVLAGSIFHYLLMAFYVL